MGKTTLDPEVIKSAVELACRAPSVHNSQPWRWVADGAELHLFADPERVVHATDRTGREAIISCGAVLHHLRVAMAAAGWTANVDRFPNPNNLEHLSTIDFSALTFVTDAHRARADTILRRRTDRLPFAAPANWAAFEPVLRSTLDNTAIELDVLPDDARPQLAEASRLTESLRRYDSYYHAELQWWTAAFEVSEGLPHSSLVSVAENERVEVARNFPVSIHQDRRTELTRDQSKILVVSSHEDTYREALGCGEVLSDVLLECTMAGLATCTLTHMTELEASRDIIRALIGTNIAPQLLIRVGVAPAMEEVPPPTPRRPLQDVLEFRH